MKKVLSLIFALCLLLSVVPASAIGTAAAAPAEVPLTEPKESVSTATPAAPIVSESKKVTEVVEKPTILTAYTFSKQDADCQIFRHVDKEVFNAGKHVTRLPEEEELDTYVFRNSDGTKSVYYMDEAVKFRDSDGRILEKDLALTASKNGYTTAQNDIQLTIPNDPSGGIRLSYNGECISIIPQGGVSGVQAQATDQSVTYPNYFGEGISLRYTPTLSGVKEDILLSAYTGVHSFTFLLNTGGLNLYQSNGHFFLAESKLSERRIDLGEILTYDATGRFSMGTMTSQTITAGQLYRLTITADEAFLTDKNTTYPVTIDPTVMMSDFTNDPGSIEDAAIYQGKPTLNYGSYQYLHIGDCRDNDTPYGVGRAVFRLKGIAQNNVYDTIGVDQIESLEFYVRETSGTSSATVDLYPLIGNSSWSESYVTWNNIGSYSSEWDCSAELINNQVACFDITPLCKQWKNGTRNIYCGFMLKHSNESSPCKHICSSEYTITSSHRPYAVLTYHSVVTLSEERAAVDVGNSVTLSATTAPTGLNVTWSSSDTSIATVSNGVVTGLKAGTVTITATVFGGGEASCTVYVTIADGVYYIKNGGLCLGIDGINNNTPAKLFAQTTSGPAQLRQLWKIKYIGAGYYTVRSMYKTDRAIRSTSGAVGLTTVAVTDFLNSIPVSGRWQIDRGSSGYIFKYTGSSSTCMHPTRGSLSPGQTVITDVYSSGDTGFQWTLEKVTSISDQVLLINTQNGLPATNAERYIAPGETLTLSDLNLVASFVSMTTNAQNIEWVGTPTGYSIANANKSTGAITGVSPGETKIRASVKFGNGTVYDSTPYTVICAYFANLEVCYDNGYLTRYPNAIDRINQQMGELQEFYFEEFGIWVNYSSPQKFTSYADANCYTSPTINCNHGQCLNSSCTTDLAITLQTYHHKNIRNIMLRIPFPDTSKTLKVAYIGHDICLNINGNCSREKTSSNPVLGVAISKLGLMAMTNLGDSGNVMKTLLHEFGHLFNAPDHYGQGYPTTENMNTRENTDAYSKYCIYGEHRNDATVISERLICEGCRMKIEENACNYDHEP